jgi:cell wall-associated NlpC family hydrolase
VWRGPAPADLDRPVPRRALARALAGLLDDRAARLPGAYRPAEAPAAVHDIHPGDGDRAAIERVVGARLLGTSRGRFLPARPVPMRVARLAAVRALGLEEEQRGLRAIAGYRVTGFGAAEVLARELGLVVNHPTEVERRERQPGQPLTWAEMFSLIDRAGAVEGWRLERLSRFREISLPATGAVRHRVIRAALAQIGRPYVWGGSWPGPRSPWGRQAVGGFDCSGLVWFAFRRAGAARTVAPWRTTADRMAFGFGARRIPVARALPGDLVFFGPRGPRSRPGTISHVGIALGEGWMVHASGSRGGVSISHLDDYWPSATAFARRVRVPAR